MYLSPFIYNLHPFMASFVTLEPRFSAHIPLSFYQSFYC